MKVLLCGGGTIGTVSPLLAIKEEIEKKQSEAEFLWVGTEKGVEKAIIKKEKIEYKSVKTGKLRRYFSWQNFIDPFLLVIGFFQALVVILKFKPDIILTAGSYVCVSVGWAGWMLKRKVFVHQQDIVTGLANKMLAVIATKVTVSFSVSKKDFPQKKTVLIGNPVREKIFVSDVEKAKLHFKLENDLPTVLVMGGSLGAEKINELIFQAVPELINFCQIIHVIGKGNMVEWVNKDQFGENVTRYHDHEYLYDELRLAYAASDLVICRAGLSTLSELAALGKPTVLIPIPNNQQEKNAQYFSKSNSVILLDQNKISGQDIVRTLNGLFSNPVGLEHLAYNMGNVMPKDSTVKYYQLIENELSNKK